MAFQPTDYSITPYLEFGISEAEADAVQYEIYDLDGIDTLDDVREQISEFEDLDERAPNGLSSRARYKKSILEAILDEEGDGGES